MAIADFLKMIFGSKSDRDMKQIKPILEKVLAAYPAIDKLSNDELRAHSEALKARIREVEAPFEKRIEEIKGELEKDIPVKKKEDLATESDRLVKEEDDAIEVILMEILPEAFAIMKSTARRFAENAEIEVTATDFDRKLSIDKDFVRIEERDGKDVAIYQNHWIAGGNEITWDMVHYDVQIVGGIVLHQGKIAEMATGEGKTLVATLPVFLNALAGKGVHVVTVNDYLSKRDSEWMGPLYMFHGLSVDCIDKHQPNSDERKRAYNCDITFGTNNEFGFDYLRDNMAVTMNDLVQRKHHYAIVDEVDSVLIDDARTPLIISGPVPKNTADEQFMEFRPYVERLYTMQRAFVTQTLNDAKKAIAAGDEAEGAKLLLRCQKGLPKYQPLIKFLSEPGMKLLLQKGENYYMQDNEREMPVVTDPLYFVISEQQHSVDMTDKGHELLAGMTGEADFFVLPDVGSKIAEIEKEDIDAAAKQEKKDALMEEFSLKSERVHTMIQLMKAYAMFQKDVDYVIMDGKVKIVDEQTGRIMEGRRWSDGLHQAVEAKENVKVEDPTQTFATITLQNYFRMYHKLAGMTGTAETEAGEFWSIYKLDVVVIPTNRPVIRDDQNDLIYKTKRAKYKAVIARVLELRKEGRPVLVGTTDVETSELLLRMMERAGIHDAQLLNAKQHQREAEIVARAGQSSTVTIATNMAGRGTDIKLSPEVKALGGLAIIGTERHDSRRVDRQLRGRAGRQGDPGSSTFYVSLEDKLMRLFGSERIAGIVDRMGMTEDDALESKMLSGRIEQAQRKVEENNFGIRKRLIEYDDVMNNQRNAIYSRRRNALSGERIEIDILNMMIETVDLFVEKTDGMTYEDFSEYLMSQMSIDPGFDAAFYEKAKPAELRARLVEHMQDVYNRRMEALINRVNPVVKEVYEKQGKMYENIAIPITDGRRILRLGVNLKKAYENEGKEVAKALSKTLILWQIDEHWKNHLRDMDDLRQSVQNASYEQKDPLVVYKLESYNLFADMLEALNKDVLTFLFRSAIALREDAPATRAPQPRRSDMSQLQTNRNNLSTNGEQKANMPVKAGQKIGRNDPCPCGSGLKYKNCHGKGLV
ncbi:MAG: preprotein translocase subunit SecA [Bacteroidales bacterium]|nr:preprotein translocase subunit SecA [Bacteroidales bacterium]